ncbi:uncharacterized protein KY384_000278 [Bacidia gigantensis]|uniref:uncharacterized protein n=1 Tax=Bacidia gigantensis TaxID=2732470 RepID=UPI001D0470EE|nr:uncharacterized protein KY384_000278 [Bacidia gigantensis]KAG8526285.1 hypothetical protein KY384_000278 [Bacidia gigantensis]
MAALDRDVLPPILKPLHYKLDIYDLELGGEFSFAGTVRIDIGVKSPTKSIIINAHKLKLRTAQVSGQKASEITYDEKRQRATLEFPEVIQESKNSVLQIEYTGIMNSDMAGFYRSKYKPKDQPAKSVPKEGEHHLMFSTQFESCDARRAFPCFDEPNLKASFDVSIELPNDQIALSNMPEKESKSSSKPGQKLLAWVVADLKYVETRTSRSYNGEKLPVRVYTTPGHEKQGQFGADVCAKVVDFYSDIFELEYPLPKIDLVAVHEFSHGAMEVRSSANNVQRQVNNPLQNWGLITYRTTAILYDPETSDAFYKNRVSYVVAHGE